MLAISRSTSLHIWKSRSREHWESEGVLADKMEDTEDSKLEMTFMPSTIEHLGARLYSTLPPIISELIANSLDADASTIEISLNDREDEKTVSVKDDGNGMSFEEINTKFLRIGRNRREDEAENGQVSPKGRPITGKKGLGKLSFFGIAKKIEVSTVKDGLLNVFVLDWDKIVKDQSDSQPLTFYEPDILEKQKPTGFPNGTTIILREIQRTSNFDSEKLADSLSRYFIIENGVHISISRNGAAPIELDNSRRYGTLEPEFEWDVPKGIPDIAESEFSCIVSGKIYTTKKPIPPSTHLRGITLFSRNKLVNLPEYFSDSSSSHFFSYLSGWLQVDFIDDLEPDVIETNRQSLNWDHPVMHRLREYLREIVRLIGRNWRERRSEAQVGRLASKSNIDVKKWKDTVPQEIKDDLEPLIGALSQSADMPEKEADTIKGFEHLHRLIPEYPLFHWRHLEPNLQTIVRSYYEREDYYEAVRQGAITYTNCVRSKSQSGPDVQESRLFASVFNKENPLLDIVSHYRKPNGEMFTAETIGSISDGHKLLAMAFREAFRNPLSHETPQDLRESDIFSEKDCLDALSILSHLFRRLDNSVVISQTPPVTPPPS